MISENLILSNLSKDSEYVLSIRELRGKYKKSFWNIIPLTSEVLLNIPDNGYTFTKYGSSKKPKFKKYKTIKAVNYGVVSEEALHQLLNQVDLNGEYPFSDSVGIALCYGKNRGLMQVFVSSYKTINGEITIYGDGSGGGGNLTPCSIPPKTAEAS